MSAALTLFDGLAFGLPAIPVAIFVIATGRLPVLLDLFPVYGGPFEILGPAVLAALLVAFAAVCGVEIVAGRLLWRERRRGGVVGLAFLPIQAVFWFGFALPVPVIIAVVRVPLLLYGWPLIRDRGGSGDGAAATRSRRGPDATP
ncbi:hypothetical protein [Actinomycetospora aeridis]|uniref:Uncharacterized protein n=1 Tax=Actinomycetospora aeridis TaxID=3129231 RepID=A0ABU8N5K2_9PSEU